MKKPILFFIILTTLGISAHRFFSYSNGQEFPLPKVYISNTSIVYDGDLTAEGIEQVKALYSKDIKNIVLNSLGGEINLGMDLGEWIYDHELDVVVKYAAFSSAANYVFPAGRNKFLYKDSFIGWHGGATQKPTSFFEKIFMYFILRNYMDKAREREDKFFEKIGVDQKITTFGQEGPYEYYGDSYKGWTYSLDMLKKLGVHNIILIDGAWTPITEFEDSKLFIIEEKLLKKEL